jgi:hypothetical protein
MVERRDLEAAIQARQELGKEYEPEVIDAFLEKIDARLAEQRRLPAKRDEGHQGAITPLVLGSIALGIPITAVALSNAPGAGGIAVAIVAWIAIAIANIAVAVTRR